MTEKLDGHRGLWDGSSIYTRHGNRMKVNLGDFPAELEGRIVDGEMWYVLIDKDGLYIMFVDE